MPLKTRALKDDIGTEIVASVDELLRPEAAAQVRQLLIQRGVLVFPRIGISDEELAGA